MAFEEGILRFEDVKLLGLMTMMFEFMGVPMTFPFGARVRPLKPSVPTIRFEAARVTGLNWMTLAVPGYGTMTFPLVKRHAPCWRPGPKVQVEP